MLISIMSHNQAVECDNKSLSLSLSLSLTLSVKLARKMQSSSANLARHSASSCSASRRLWRLLPFGRQQPPAKGGGLLVPTHLSVCAAFGATTAAGGRAKPDPSAPTPFPGFDPTPPDFEPSSGADPGFPGPLPPDREFSPPPPDSLPPESPPNVLPPRGPQEMPPPLWPPEEAPPGFMFY